MKYAQIVMGSAGTGKSTYCHALQEHCATTGRSVRVANLDPAAEAFKYSVAFDIRELVSVDDVMTEMGMGPNGALLFCMEYLTDNMEWLDEQLETMVEDDYLILDCPGQIELYSHVPVMRMVVDSLKRAGFAVCGVYCIDATFITDAPKLIAGNLAALSAMLHLELPHINVLTKCDLVEGEVLESYLTPSGDSLAAELSAKMGPRYRSLNMALVRLLDEYDMVSFVPMNIKDEDSLHVVLQHADNAMQYGEDMEPKEPVEGDDADDRAARIAEMVDGGVAKGDAPVRHHRVVLTPDALVQPAKVIAQALVASFPEWYGAVPVSTTGDWGGGDGGDGKASWKPSVALPSPPLEPQGSMSPWPAPSMATATAAAVPLPARDAAPPARSPPESPSPFAHRDLRSFVDDLDDLLHDGDDAGAATIHTVSGAATSSQRPQGHGDRAPPPATATSGNRANVSGSSKMDAESVLSDIGDLNRVGPAKLQVAKARMDIVFDAHRVKPGDPGYIYDKRVEFAPPTEANEWDE